MKRALTLALVNPAITGVLVRGERGTGKSTAVRALAALMPPVRVVDGCRLRCDPEQPENVCADCRRRLEESGRLPARELPMPVVELPLGATEEMIIGTLDLEQTISRGKVGFQPGLLARAHRGVLYIDEVNLLPDHLVDVLLDAAAMGTNFVEREGVSFSHPCRMMLVGTMNPQEGELRPQLIDRFDLCVEVKTISDPDARRQLLERRLAFEREPAAFCERYREQEEQLALHVRQARSRLAETSLDEKALGLIVAIANAAGVEGHRAELAMARAAVALCAWNGGGTVGWGELQAAARLVLAHRVRTEPGEEKAVAEKLDESLKRIFAATGELIGSGAGEKKNVRPPPMSPESTA